MGKENKIDYLGIQYNKKLDRMAVAGPIHETQFEEAKKNMILLRRSGELDGHDLYVINFDAYEGGDEDGKT